MKIPECHTVTPFIDETLRMFLHEDIGSGDLTTLLTIDEGQRAEAVITVKEEMVVAGLPFMERLFYLYDSQVMFEAQTEEGALLSKGTVIAAAQGKARSLLAVERAALNLVQRLSGIATLTHRFVSATADLPVKIVDTRKTAPGLRIFEKYAVRTGGGANHRFGLYDGILIKDNHIKAAGGIKEAVKLARHGASHLMKIEIEVTDFDELREALDAQADVIMLDNMSVEEVTEAVKLVDKKAMLEVSGGINLHRVRSFALTGVDIISIGAFTHSARAVDIGMDIVSNI